MNGSTVYLIIFILALFPHNLKAKETPFYLLTKDSPIPQKTNEEKVIGSYVPGENPYADWLLRRAEIVKNDLVNCQNEFLMFKDLETKKGKIELNWVIIKARKKLDYLVFLEDKFKGLIGNSFFDSGYNLGVESLGSEMEELKNRAYALSFDKNNKVKTDKVLTNKELELKKEDLDNSEDANLSQKSEKAEVEVNEVKPEPEKELSVSEKEESAKTDVESEEKSGVIVTLEKEKDWMKEKISVLIKDIKEFFSTTAEIPKKEDAIEPKQPESVNPEFAETSSISYEKTKENTSDSKEKEKAIIELTEENADLKAEKEILEKKVLISKKDQAELKKVKDKLKKCAAEMKKVLSENETVKREISSLKSTETKEVSKLVEKTPETAPILPLDKPESNKKDELTSTEEKLKEKELALIAKEAELKQKEAEIISEKEKKELEKREKEELQKKEEERAKKEKEEKEKKDKELKEKEDQLKALIEEEKRLSNELIEKRRKEQEKQESKKEEAITLPSQVTPVKEETAVETKIDPIKEEKPEEKSVSIEKTIKAEEPVVEQNSSERNRIIEDGELQEANGPKF